MDALLTEEQRGIVDSVDRFAARHLPPEEVRRRDAAHVPPYDLLPMMGAAGFFGLAVPAEHGGLGLGWTEVALVQERLGRHGYMAASIFNRVVGFGVMSVLTYGSVEQKRALLPGLLAGQFFMALALTEPGAGSDAGAIRTRARRDGSGYVISGSKIWISDAEGARYLLTAARTGAESSGAEGITLFLVPSDAPGVRLSLLAKVGNNCMPSFEVGLEDVRVGDEAVIGTVGNGFRHLMSTLHYSRASMAATVTGAAQAALDTVIAHARGREQFGRPISSFQVIAHRLADLQIRIDLSQLMVRHLATLIARGLPCRREAAQAKIVATETLRDVADQGMQVMASAGYAADSDIQRFWRDSRLYTFGEGTNEILRDGIARELGFMGKGRT